MSYQQEIFANRLRKRFAHLRKWARREDAGAWRVYDRDIPEVPLAVDVYYLLGGDGNGEPWLCMYLYERPFEKAEEDEAAWLAEMTAAAAEALGVAKEHIVVKVRQRQKGAAQYERLGRAIPGVVQEAGLRFCVDLGGHLDTGLFLDHRPLRALVRAEAHGKDVLNLFCYTGAFSVCAAAGGAASVTSVDLSRTYLEVAERNMALNGFGGGAPKFTFVRSDAGAFLRAAQVRGQKWDLIILDPPTFSNSKKTSGVLDVNEDWPALAGDCLGLLRTEGVLYFSTNSRRLKFDPELLDRGAANKCLIEDISPLTIPEDFKSKPRIHRVWRITRCP
jgi:23S rRNA (cytosine1962-C5)-methyltransferase